VRAGETGWIVNRFVCPASKLAELGDEPLRLSIVLDTGELPAADSRIDAVEAAGIDPEVLFDAAPEVYCELPLRNDVSFRILQLGELGLRAKVRCGGGSVLPSVPALAEFVQACKRLEVPFKATAGLHQPLRHGDEHGFLNLLAAAVFDDEEEALSDEDPGSFGISAESFRWRDRTSGVVEIGRARDLFASFGSCSAQEPIDGLRALGMLP
jgi:hypothetical protein